MDTDIRVVLTALAVAIGALVHALAFTVAEGALPVERWTLRVAGVVVLLSAAYTGGRLWW